MRAFNLVKSLSTLVSNITSLPFREGLGLGRLILCLSLAVFGVEGAWGRGTNYLINESPNAEMMTSGSSPKSKTYSISKPGATMVFTARKHTGVVALGGVNLYGYTDTNCSEGKKELKDLTDLPNNSNGKSSGEFSIDRKYRSFKFEGHGTLKKTLLTVKLTQATYLEVDNVEKQYSVSRDFGTAQINAENSTSTFVVNYSNVDNMTISITGDGASQYSVNKSSITGGKGCYGNETITITYKHDVAGEHKAVITVSDGTSAITVNVSGTTTKLDPSITWSSEDATFNVDDVLSATNGAGLTVTLSSTGNEQYVNCSGNTATMLEATTGTITITANVTGNDIYNSKSFTKDITITNKEKQYITWNQDFSKLKTTDANKTIILNAKAVNKDGNETGLSVSYELVGDKTGLSLSQNGNTWTLTYSASACKNTTIIAKQEGNATYAPASNYSLPVKVIDPTQTCSTEETVINSAVNLENTSAYYNIDIPETMEIKVNRSKTGWFDFYTKGFDVELYSGINATGTRLNQFTYSANDINNPKTISLSDLNINAKSVKLISHASNGYTVTSLTYTHYHYCNTDKTELNYATYPNTKTDAKQVVISYANYPIEIECSSNKIGIDKSSFGDCGVAGSETINVTYTTGANTGNETKYIYVKDNTGATLKTITINVSIQKVSQNITSTSIVSSYKTTDKIELSATSNSGLTNFEYSCSPSDVASFDGNIMTFNKSCDNLSITVTQPGDNVYSPCTTTVSNIKVNKVTPAISTNPTATAITYGQKLSESSLTGGQASVQNYRGTAGSHNVEGSFVWSEPDAVKTANNGEAKAYQVNWAPTGADAALYNSTTCNVEVLINRADQTITWETGTNISLYTPSASVLNATTTGDGSIVYTIDPSSGDGVGTITDNVLTLHKSGKLVINANAATTANYNAATQVQKTFEVGKRGLTIAWEDEDESGNVITTYAAGKGDIGNHFVALDAQTKDVVDIPITITNSDNTSVINIQNNKLYVDCAGTATITATTAATDQYGAGSGTVTLTSLINTPVFTWQIPQPAPNTAYTNFFTSSNKDSDCNLTFTSNNPTLAKVEGGKLIVGGNAETDADVTFTVTQTGNCRWEAHEQTFTIHVKKPANHVPFTITKDNYGEFKTGGSGAFSWDGGMKVGNGLGGFNWDNKTFVLHFSGIPDKLSFSYFCTDVRLVATQPGWWVKESEDGVNWPEEKLWNETSDSQSERQAPTQQLKPKTRYLMFCYSGNFAGVFKNINVTELKYFYAAPNQTATEHVKNVNFDTYTGVGDFPVKRTIYLRHANAGSDLQITIGDTKNFRLEHNISTGTDQMGDDPITIIYEPDDFGTHNTNLTIHDGQNADIVIPVYAAAQPGATYTFIGTDGDAKKLENWKAGETTPISLPNAYHPVAVQQPMVVSSEMAFYELDVRSDQYSEAKVTIAPTGGLTIVGPNGVRVASADKLIIQSSIEQGKEGQGYLRISPKYTGNMPQVTVQLATRSTLDNGANKDATWQYVGIPTATQSFEVDYITWLYEWSEPNGWVNLKNATQPVTLEAWKGYAVTQYGQPTYEWKGQLLREDKTIELTCTTTGSGMNGDNLFANSYSSPIDVKRFTEDDFEGTLDKTFYIFNSGSWNQWNDNKGEMVKSGTMSSTNPGQYIGIPALSAVYLEDNLTMIAPMQGVYVYTETGGAKIKLNYTKHVWQASSTKGEMNLPLRAPQDNSDIDALVSEEMRMRDSIARVDREKCEALSHRIRISATSENSGADFLYVLEEENFTHGYDNGYEAPKIMADAEGVLNIYTNEAEAGLMSVAATNDVNEMFIGFNAGEDVNYELYITSVIGDDLELMDMQTGDRFALKDSVSYAFAATPNSEDPYRFRIFKSETKPVVPTGWTGLGDKAKIWYNKQTLYISDAAANSTAAIYTADGVTLKQVTFNHNTTISTADMPEGVYTVRVEDSVLKFFVKH